MIENYRVCAWLLEVDREYTKMKGERIVECVHGFPR